MSTRALARAGITLRIRRQDTRAAMPHWEVFEVPLAPRLTLAEVLDRLAFLPLNARRERVAPVSYTWGCTGPGCVSCMLIAARRPVPACETLVEELVAGGGTLVLEPMAKLGVVRDLLVESQKLRGARAQLHAFTTPAAPNDTALDSTANAPALSPIGLLLSTCTRCGACIEACPETRTGGGFVGAAAIVASQLADARDLAQSESQSALHTSTTAHTNRHLALAYEGGIHECGDARQCVAVCPAKLPLDEVLGRASRDAFIATFRIRSKP